MSIQRIYKHETYTLPGSPVYETIIEEEAYLLRPETVNTSGLLCSFLMPST